jgi:hypothetical protein
MLKSGAGLMGTGEMYVPLEFLTGTVAACATEHRPVFLQSVYLAHLMTGAATDVEDHISNTAHVADLSPYAQNDIHCLKILLIRNPADVAISRTLRKTEYRSYLRRTEVSDQAYLRENIRKVDLFYRTVSRDNYDLVCRYEDLVADPVPILEAVGALLGLPLDREMLRKIAGETKAKETPDQDLSEERRLQYAPVIDAFRREAADALREVSETLGYG